MPTVTRKYGNHMTVSPHAMSKLRNRQTVDVPCGFNKHNRTIQGQHFRKYKLVSFCKYPVVG